MGKIIYLFYFLILCYNFALLLSSITYMGNHHNYLKYSNLNSQLSPEVHPNIHIPIIKYGNSLLLIQVPLSVTLGMVKTGSVPAVRGLVFKS